MFFKRKKAETIIYARPLYKDIIKIYYINATTCYKSESFEIVECHINDCGFLCITLPNADRKYINTLLIKSFDVISEKIEYEEKTEQ